MSSPSKHSYGALSVDDAVRLQPRLLIEICEDHFCSDQSRQATLCDNSPFLVQLPWMSQPEKLPNPRKLIACVCKLKEIAPGCPDDLPSKFLSGVEDMLAVDTLHGPLPCNSRAALSQSACFVPLRHCSICMKCTLTTDNSLGTHCSPDNSPQSQCMRSKQAKVINSHLSQPVHMGFPLRPFTLLDRHHGGSSAACGSRIIVTL